jgi:repressor LexA
MNERRGDLIFSENLRRLLRENHKKAQELADFLGVSKVTVSEWVNCKKQPRMDKVDRMCVFFNCTRSDLMDEPSENLSPATGLVKLYDGIPAGAPALLDEYVVDHIPTTLPHPEDYAAIIVHGESMINAGIPNGCTVMIIRQPCAENGQIVACRVNGESVTLKRFSQQGDTVVLSPANPAFSPIVVPVSDFENGAAQILGVLKQVIINY